MAWPMSVASRVDLTAPARPGCYRFSIGVVVFGISGYAPVPVIGERDVSDRSTPPVVGDAAPEFELAGSDGKTHRLADHRGRRAVVLAWFPKAYTPG